MDPLNDPPSQARSLPLLLQTDTEIITPADPPPPYPSRPRRARRHATSRQQHQQSPSRENEPLSYDRARSVSPIPPGADENTPLLSGNALPSSPRNLRSPNRRTAGGRPRSLSHGSILSHASAAPSLAQTVISLFADEESDCDYPPLPPPHQPHSLHIQRLSSLDHEGERDRRNAWRRYFRPLVRRVYWMALFHLVVLNFPYALAAWVFLFVFTLTGTTLMIALPLGTVLCFFDLLGARAFSRGELYLQSIFHRPLAYPLPHPPLPMFTRLRPPTEAEIEAGHESMVYETSFYKNAWAMFTDSTSYQALFYFLVIKPSITLILSISLVILTPICFVLVLPAPAFLRAMRKLGIWQANVAIEGLYIAVS